MIICFLPENSWEAGKCCYYCLWKEGALTWAILEHIGRFMWDIWSPGTFRSLSPGYLVWEPEMGFLGPQQGKWPPDVGTVHGMRSSAKTCLKSSGTNVVLSHLFPAPAEQSSASLGKVLRTFMLLYDVIMSPPDFLSWGRTSMGVFQQWSRYSPSSLKLGLAFIISKYSNLWNSFLELS